jgi:hypothetical protein
MMWHFYNILLYLIFSLKRPVLFIHKIHIKEETALRGAELCTDSNQMLGEPRRQKGRSLPSERLIS